MTKAAAIPLAVIIPLPWQRPPLSQNDRDERKRGGARKIAEAKEQARWAIRAAHAPTFTRATVELHYRIPDRRRREADNLAVVLKICNDALVLEGVITPDDSWQYIPRVAIEIHPPEPGQTVGLWLSLEEVT